MDYDLVIAGSDQIWNPEITADKDHIYFLDYPGEYYRAAYAVSLGDIKNPFYSTDEFYVLTGSFDQISLREKDACDFVEGFLDKKVEWTLDPALLLHAEEWGSLAEEVDMDLPSRYIYLYILEYNEDLVRIAEDLAQRLHIVIVCTSASLHARPHMETRYCNRIGPAEFLYLIKNADVIVSASFHALALSVLFHKQSISVSHYSGSARQYSLLRMVGAEECIFESFSDYMNKAGWTLRSEYDSFSLEKRRKISLEYLESVFQEAKERKNETVDINYHTRI